MAKDTEDVDYDTKSTLEKSKSISQATTLDTEEDIKFPKSIFYIIINEFCERFCYYGMKTVLFLYLTDVLRYDKNEATVWYHTWAGLCYFFPIIGGILADTYLGKFKTIVYLSVIYLLGNVLLSVVAISELALPQRGLTFLGLLFIAVGTGGIKPCVSSFGGDQFILPQQEAQLAYFFSFFYFAINAGSLISTFITPLLREDVKCFGEETCFPAAFGVPAVLMLVSVVVFIIGKPLYKVNKPKGNIFLTVCKCVVHAISNKSKHAKSNQTKDHWLDYAEDKYSSKIIGDIKILLDILVLFIPIPVFWALFDQQGSRWTYQANRMSGALPGVSFTIKADQMQVVNPFLILAFIPLFQYFVYPIIAKIGINTPLRRLTVGGFLSALAFIMSALVEFQINSQALPENGATKVNMLWLLPQYIVITAGEVMLSITGLEFAYSQAPTSMKSVVSAMWLLTVAFGNVIVVIVAESKFFTNQAYEFLLFAVLMIVDMFIFILLAVKYQYKTHSTEEEEEVEDDKEGGQKGSHKKSNATLATVTNDD